MPEKIKKIINQHFFQPAWYSIVVNPYFIARRGLLKEIKKFSVNLSPDERILDVGCGIKPYSSLFGKIKQYIGIDIKGGGHYDQEKTVDKFYDGLNIPFPEKEFEVVICTQVLEHAVEPETLLKEIYRVLKPGGKVFLTMPFVWNEHETPYDFRRFTRYEHERLFKNSGLTIASLKETTGVFRTVGQLISAFIFERLFKKNKPLKLLSSVFFCFPIQAFFIFLDFIFRNHWLTLDYVIIAKK